MNDNTIWEWGNRALWFGTGVVVGLVLLQRWGVL